MTVDVKSVYQVSEVEVAKTSPWKAFILKHNSYYYVLDEYCKTAGTRSSLPEAVEKASELLSEGREWRERIVINCYCILEDTVRLPNYVELVIEGLIKAPDGFNKPMFDISGLKEVSLKGTGIIDGNRSGQSADMDGVYASESVEKIKISGLKFRGFTRSAIRIKATEWSREVDVTDCVFENCPHPVHLFLVEQYSIDCNFFNLNLESGHTVFADICRKGSISLNRVYGGDINLRVAGAEEVVIANNVIRGETESPTGGGGITVVGASRQVDVVGNVVSNKPMEGIEFAQVDYCQAVGNMLIKCAQGGFKCWDFRHCRISENMVIDCGFVEAYGDSQYPISASIILYSSDGAHSTHHDVVEDNIIIFTGEKRAADYAVAEARLAGEVDYNIIRRNHIFGEPAIGPLHIVGEHTIVKDVSGYKTENGGTATFSGDGSTTQFTIPHELAKAPTNVVLEPMTADASKPHYVTWDDSYIYVHFLEAPPAGVDNVKFSWIAKC